MCLEFDPIAAPLPVADEENNVEEDIHKKVNNLRYKENIFCLKLIIQNLTLH